MDNDSGKHHWSSPPAGDEATVIDVEAGRAPPPWRATQDALDALFDQFEGLDCPTCYSYRELVSYLANPAAAHVDGARAEGDYAAVMACRSDPRGGSPHRQAVQRIRRAAGDAPVYLADGRAFVRGALPGEFPELAVFNIEMKDAFAETGSPGFYVETTRFADLRSLSRMRREVRRTGLRCGDRDPTRLIALLLGLSVPAQ